MFEISGKVALITGGASGLGLQYAIVLLRNGLRACTLADVNEVYGKEAINEINDEFGDNRAIFIKTDVTNKIQFEDAFKGTVKAFKHIDILINNAGILNDFMWEKEILVNVNGTINGCLLGLEEYLPKYRSGNEAIIVNISSTAGLGPRSAIPVYCATKHAIIGLSRSFGTELHYKRTMVKVLTLCPGVTKTPLIDFSDCEERTLNPDYKSIFDLHFQMAKQQPANFVAQSIIPIIQEGASGSVWVVENELPPNEIRFFNSDE